VKADRARLLVCFAFAILAAGLIPDRSQDGLIGVQLAQAQNIGQRVVEGKVLDSNSAVVAGATVFLKNLKTKTIRSYTTAADGRFRFTQVNMAEDHDLWAEKGDKKSATKSVSSWDSRTDFECELRLK
jgi:hypothetical protein